VDARLGGLLDGPGRVIVRTHSSATELLLLSPDGPRWVVLPLLVGALAALLRRTRRAEITFGWGVALCGYGVAGWLDRTGHWPGVALQVAAVGLLMAALVGADGLQSRLAHRSFGWPQVTAGLLIVAAGLVPLVAGVQWLRRGADDPVQRGARPVLPAFARAELALTPGIRVLVLRPDGTSVAYDLTTAAGELIGAADVPPAAAQQSRLDAVVSDLVTPRGSDAAEALSTRAVRYVAVPAVAGSDRLVAGLDAQPGLTRRAGGDVLLWDVVAPTSRLTVLPPTLAAAALRGERGPARDLVRTDPPRPIRSGRAAAGTIVGPGRIGRLLVLAEAADSRWRASFNGVPMKRRTAWGWAQAFELPAKRGLITLDRDNAPRHRLLTGQAVGLALVLVLSLPAPHKRRGLEVDDEAGDQPEVEAG
jgi:hypothetical protein